MWIFLLACSPAPEGLGLPCTETDELRTCPHATMKLRTGWAGLERRQVHWQIPTGDAPPKGWPVAILFQGSFHSAETFWSSKPNASHGRWHQVGVVQELLATGIAVVTPETKLGGLAYWDTNVPPFDRLWSTAPDHRLMLDLLDAIDEGDLGDLDPDTLYAAGISSGGYMTSRMAVSYPGRFSALAIQSGSYATCSGLLCSIPELDNNHPPTLFLVGGRDKVVPPDTSADYADALEDQGTEVGWVSDPEVGHAWLKDAPEAIAAWFAGGGS